MSSPSQTQHVTQTICNTLWGHQLSFHPFEQGDHPINFCSLWPTKQTLIETYKEAGITQAPYELVKLLLATNNSRSLDALLEEQVIRTNQHFSPGNVTLAHLACALGLPDIVNVLFSRGSTSNGIWSQKNDEDHSPSDVCFNQRIRQALPNRSIFPFRTKVHHGQVLKSEDKDTVFQLAKNSDEFYRTIVKLQMFAFDVNREYNDDGDLLIHVAIKGGLTHLPLLFVLVNIFKADVSLKNRDGLTPLCLAAKLGEEKIAEILVCVFGADVNASSNEDLKTPLHHGVLGNHPRVVSMLLRRNADANREDKNLCVPAFLARKNRFLECRQIINQYLRERTERIAQETASGALVVSKLCPADINIVTSSGCTLVMVAAMNNQEATLSELVKMNGCPLDFRQMRGCELLDNSLTSSIISRAYVPPEEDSPSSLKTAVHYAAERGYAGCLKILLDANAHPALRDATGWLPLHYACESSHLECVRAIVTLGSQLGLSGLKPALAIAEANNYAEIAAVLRDANERRQSQFITPLLFEVAHSGNKDLLFRCLENGDDVNPINEESGDWPLLLAAGYGYLNLVTQLHELGGQVTRRNKMTYFTPLHTAARGGHTDVVRYLLQFCLYCDGSPPANPLPSGANDEETPLYLDLNGRIKSGATPLELAATQGHLEVVRVLLSHGASTSLPDSNGRPISCTAFAGTQFLIETNRKERLKRVVNSLHMQRRISLQQFQRIWQGPSDFNLHTQSGDSILMVAAEFASPEVLKYLVKSAQSCKPGMLISPGEPLPLPSLFNNSSHSDDSFSERSLPRDFVARFSSDDHHGRTHSATEYCDLDSDEKEKERHTALPAVFRGHPPNQRRSITDRGSRRKPMRQFSRPPAVAIQRRKSAATTSSSTTTATTTSSGDDESDVIVERHRLANGARNTTSDGPMSSEADSGTETPTGEFNRLISYRSPKDGQTVLHRAANGCQSENVVILLQADEGLANKQDHLGNTALHLACNKAHKPTIKALLNFKKDCVDTTVRNNNQQLPEEGCVKTSIRQLVCKERQKQVGNDLPDPPKWKDKPPNMASVERAPPNGVLPHDAINGLQIIPEIGSGSLPSTTSELTASQFQERMQELKIEYTNIRTKTPGPVTEQ